MSTTFVTDKMIDNEPPDVLENKPFTFEKDSGKVELIAYGFVMNYLVNLLSSRNKTCTRHCENDAARRHENSAHKTKVFF